MNKRPSQPTLPDHDPTTLPPPAGAEDAYSAKTRVATLPENVLSAMREQEAVGLARAERRTRSGTRMAAAKPPSAFTFAPPTTDGSVPPSSDDVPPGFTFTAGASLTPARPAQPAPYSPIPPSMGAAMSDPAIPQASPPGFDPPPPGRPFYSYEQAALEDHHRQRSILKSFGIVALFAAMGAVVAALLNHFAH